MQLGGARQAAAIVAADGAVLTYGALGQLLESTAGALNRGGIGRRDRVALVTNNGPVAATAFVSVASACGCAPLNPAYKADEFAFYLRDLEPKAFLVEAGLHPAAREAAAREGIDVLDLAPAGPAGEFRIEGVRPRACSETGLATPDDVALLLHTSGTTSRPKLVPLLGANLAASAGHVAQTLRLTDADRCVNIMPLFHIHGLIAAVLSSLHAGGSVIATSGAFVNQLFSCLDKLQPTWYTAVPTMHQAILEAAPRHIDLIRARPLRFIRSSSASLPPQVLANLEEVFKTPVVEAYGMTEAAHQMASNPLPPAARKPGAVGPSAGPAIAIMGPEGRLLDSGQTGEVVIRGPNVTPGYVNMPEANAAAFTNGWFRTGDQGYLDSDGYLWLTGRLKELINRGGEKVSPREVDEVLLDHPAVAQALTFAVPHNRLGEEVGTVIVPKPGQTVDPESVREFAGRRLASFKVPRLIRVLDSIPNGPTGKPQRIGLAAKLGIEALDDAPASTNGADGPGEPKTELEQQVAAIWAAMLGRESVGLHETFASLGGDSLLAVRLMTEVNSKLGLDSPFVRFLDRGTVEAMVTDVEKGETTRNGLVELSRGPDGAVLFCLPYHNNSLVGWARLAAELRPIIGLTVVVFPGPERLPGGFTIDNIADAVWTLIRSRQPKGPYRLAGRCFGGVVALALARKIVQDGETVSMLATIDATNPAWRRSTPRLRQQAAVVGNLAHKVWIHGTRALRLPVRKQFDLVTGIVKNMRAHKERVAQSTLPPELAGVGGRTLRALTEFEPLPYRGDVLMFRTRAHQLNLPLLGWKGFIQGATEVISLPNDGSDSLTNAIVIERLRRQLSPGPVSDRLRVPERR